MPAQISPVIAYDKRQLSQLIKEAHLHGTGMSLNHIDVSNIEDFSYLFASTHFSSDISTWDMSKAKDLTAMFRHAQFTGDISKWDLSSALVLDEMFRGASFTGDISNWNVSSVKSMARMFEQSIFIGDISRWNVASVTNMHNMFDTAVFQGDLSQWDVRHAENMMEMFVRSDYSGDLSSWRTESIIQGDAVLTRHSLREMPKPCFFHWYGAMVQNRVFDPEVLAFVHRHAPTMTALGLNPVQAALAMQDHWLKMLAPQEQALTLPELNY